MADMPRLLALALVVATVAITAPAHAAPTVGPLAVTTSPLAITTTTSCADVPLTWYLTSAPADTSTWDVTGDIVDSAGASRGSIFEYEKLPVSQAGETFTLCGLVEGANNFTVAADIEAWSASFENIYKARFVAALTVTRSTPPPPVPPAPPTNLRTTIAFDGQPIWFERRTTARVGVLVEVGGACPATRRPLVLSGLRNGRWKAVAKSSIGSYDYVKARVPYTFSKIRLELPATASCTAAKTRSLKVPRG